jgi:hypothetical protein
LLAACAALAAEEEPFRAVLHRRRFRQALSRAQSLEPDNPRLLLVTLQYGTADEVAARPDPESLVEAFRRTAGTARFPDWGEAEALTMVAEMHLARDDARTARDLIEEALLLAPAYAAALDVERRIRESWSDN